MLLLLTPGHPTTCTQHKNNLGSTKTKHCSLLSLLWSFMLSRPFFPEVINDSELVEHSGLEVTLLHFSMTFDLLITTSFMKLLSFYGFLDTTLSKLSCCLFCTYLCLLPWLIFSIWPTPGSSLSLFHFTFNTLSSGRLTRLNYDLNVNGSLVFILNLSF